MAGEGSPAPTGSGSDSGDDEDGEERRIDPDNGRSYTRGEFISCYGGTHQWDSAERSPRSRRRLQRRFTTQEEADAHLADLRDQLTRLRTLVDAGIGGEDAEKQIEELEAEIAAEEALGPVDEDLGASGHTAEGEIAGRRIRWQRGREIGKGSFGTVYMAMDVATGELIACKELPRPRGDQEAQAAVEREIKLMFHVRHQNIVALYSAEWNAERVALLMELVPGGSIRNLLSQFGAFQPSVVSLYTRQLVAAVRHLHKEGIVHRDIKASNVLVSDKGAVKLSDFGTSLVVEQEPGGARSSLVGTVLWLSPEVVKSRRYSPASDVWALGCTVLEMATGGRPWDPAGLSTVEGAVLHIGNSAGDGPPLPTVPPLGADCRDLLRRCWGSAESRATCSQLLAHPFLSTFGLAEGDECGEVAGEITSPSEDTIASPATANPGGSGIIGGKPMIDHLDFLRSSWKGQTLSTTVSDCPGKSLTMVTL